MDTTAQDEAETMITDYGRPDLEPFDPDKKPLIFMQIDADYSLMNEDIPVVRLFGVTEGGNSVMLLVYNFEPYFYVPLPNNITYGPAEKQNITDMLNVFFSS